MVSKGSAHCSRLLCYLYVLLVSWPIAINYVIINMISVCLILCFGLGLALSQSNSSGVLVLHARYGSQDGNIQSITREINRKGRCALWSGCEGSHPQRVEAKMIAI